MPPPPRVLHLAYEDPRAPHSGGGSVRTQEINRRLVDHFDIDQVFVTFAGATPQRTGDLRCEHLGPRRGGRFVSQLGYFARLPGLVRRRAHLYDLIVEDFGAPFGSIGVPHLTTTPTIAVVQWLFAAEKSKQYHLPFTAVESFGVRSHRRFIAVSDGIAEQLRRRNSDAHVDVVANGLPAEVLRLDAPAGPTVRRRDIVFLGRLDVAHKGLDLLLDAYARIAGSVEQDLLVSGHGDGDGWLRAEIARRGLGDRVRLIGPTPAEARFELLAGADVVAMPSRYESFGMVAAEAAAVGTPVLTFDIACLRDLVPPDLRVPAFDVDGYARRLLEVCTDPQLRRNVERDLPRTVHHLSWDRLADRQAAVYLDAMAAAS